MQIILIQIIICYTKQLVTDITDDTSSVLQIIIIHIVLEKLLCVLEIMLGVLILLLEINAIVATIHFFPNCNEADSGASGFPWISPPAAQQPPPYIM